jgi:heme oxygenase
MNSIPSEGRVAFHSVLRETTRPEHEALDARLSLLDLTSLPSYRTFLTVHYAALRSLAAAWRREDRLEFGELMDRLRADLAAIGPAVDERIIPLAAAASSGHRLGVSYVIRGSRLGSKMLSRRVPPHLSHSYLSHEPAMPWPVFLQELEARAAEAGPDARAQIIEGAKLAFAAFDTAHHAAVNA